MAIDILIFLEKLKTEGISIAEFARQADIENNKVHQWKRKKGNPKAGDTEKIQNWIASNLKKYPAFAEFLPEFSLTQNPEILNKHGNRYIDAEDGSYIIEVDLVPFEAHARYISEADILEYGVWEKVSFVVDHVGRGKYKAWRTKGDSMFNNLAPSFYDTPDKAILLTRELDRSHWRDGFDADRAAFGWVIVTMNNILLKDITRLDLATGQITCHSRNPSPEYGDFQYPVNDVREIHKVIKRIL